MPRHWQKRAGSTNPGRPARKPAPVAQEAGQAKPATREGGRQDHRPKAGRAGSAAPKRSRCRASAKRRDPVGRRRPAAAPPPVAQAGFYEAVAIYERASRRSSATISRPPPSSSGPCIERYPEERELLERARLYLRVCERETSRAPSTPKTAAEWVYAATVALNSGDHAGALDHLQRALGEDPDSDHAHYIMAVALGMRGRRRRGARPPPPRHRAEPREPVARPPGSRSRGASATTTSFRPLLDTPPPCRRSRRRRRPRDARKPAIAAAVQADATDSAAACPTSTS